VSVRPSQAISPLSALHIQRTLRESVVIASTRLFATDGVIGSGTKRPFTIRPTPWLVATQSEPRASVWMAVDCETL